MWKEWPEDIFEGKACVSGKRSSSVFIGKHHICTTAYAQVEQGSRESAAEYIAACMNLGRKFLRVKRKCGGALLSHLEIFEVLLEEREAMVEELAALQAAQKEEGR